MKQDMITRRELTRDRLGAYVRSRVLPSLGITGGDFSLEILPEGTRSVVLRLETSSGRYVLRHLSDPVRAIQTVLTTRHMVTRGVRIPRLLRVDLSPLTRLRVGGYVLLEEWIEGQNLVELALTDRILKDLARSLASLHQVRRDAWGSLVPLAGRRGDYFASMQGRVERRLGDLARNSPEFVSVLADGAILDWFARQHCSGRQPDGYSLCHRRITDTNVLWSEEGGACLIDVITARYGHHAIDLERALYRWCDHVSRLQEVFLDEYFDVFRSVTREQWQEQRDYFRASFHLTQAYRDAKELRSLDATGEESPRGWKSARRNVIRHLVRMLDAMEQAILPPPAAVTANLRARLRRAARAR